MIDALGWIVRKLGASTLLTATLLGVALASLAAGLTDLVRGLDLGLLLPFVVLGMLAGWLLARSAVPGRTAALLASVAGAGLVVWRVGNLGPPLLGVARATAGVLAELPRWRLAGPPDAQPILLALSTLTTSVEILLVRTRDWLQSLAAGQPAFDPVAAALIWSLVVWAAAAWAGWAVRRRRQPLHAVAPAGVVLASSLAYARAGFAPLVPLLSATLVLMVLVGEDAREHRWVKAGVDFSPEIRTDLALMALPLCLLLISAAWLAPSLSIQALSDLVQSFAVKTPDQENPFAGALGVERQPAATTALDAVRASGLPRGYLLGSGPELSKQVVMVVSTGDLPPGPREAAAGRSPPRYYWRSITYDAYNGRGWATSATQTVAYPAGASATRQEVPGHRRVVQNVRPTRDLGGTLYFAGSLLTADRDYRVASRPGGDMFGALVSGGQYRAESLVPEVSEAELRSAGNSYPDDIRARYLNLPQDTPGRVLGLARDLTATAATPYDRARAIEAYLRRFPYTLDLPVPPPDRDVADYFLFDLQRGFCDYYATAMVVLSRAAGLPARMVVGYASGTYDWTNARYVVTEADAHSWPEVYFPGYGWIEFEPTAGRAAIDRPATPGSMPTPPPLPDRVTGGGWRVPGGRAWLIVPAILAVLAAGVGGWWAIDLLRLRRLAPAAAVSTVYGRLYRHEQNLGLPLQPGSTPYEVAGMLSGHLASLAESGRAAALLAPATDEARWLADLAVRTFYSRDPAGSADQARALDTWQRLDRRLWLARLLRGVRHKLVVPQSRFDRNPTRF